jgi:fused signal recognition particle receptor
MSEVSKSWLSRLKDGLGKTSAKLTDGISSIFTKKKLDQASLDDLEELLISADIGAKTANEIVKELAKGRFDKEISQEEIRIELSNIIAALLQNNAHQLVIDNSLRPQVILVCGVNGNGKTTTIGKLASFYQAQGKKVMLAACDTFRAAAVSQLEVWAKRSNCKLIQGAENADPASVAYQAYEQAKLENFDLLLIDTAGRLHNKANLMEELAKIVRVIKKIDPAAPHNTILVLDATTGQNAHLQLETFKQLVDISGLIVTKLDGTAKAGVVVALAKRFNIPVYFIGVGESINDLQPFSPEEFAKNLVNL